jgi:hypothetical protein
MGHHHPISTPLGSNYFNRIVLSLCDLDIIHGRIGMILVKLLDPCLCICIPLCNERGEKDTLKESAKTVGRGAGQVIGVCRTSSMRDFTNTQ